MMPIPRFCGCKFPCHCSAPVKEFWMCTDCVAGNHLDPQGNRVKFSELRNKPHEGTSPMSEERIPYLGYGSPEALEAAINENQGPEFQCFDTMFYSTVCSSLSQEEVEARMAARPCGTKSGWTFCEGDLPEKWEGRPNPCPCDDDPETHQHFLFAA